MNNRVRMVRLIDYIFDPLILWSHGWKRKNRLWTDPKTKKKWKQETAILICEERAGIKLK